MKSVPGNSFGDFKTQDLARRLMISCQSVLFRSKLTHLNSSHANTDAQRCDVKWIGREAHGLCAVRDETQLHFFFAVVGDRYRRDQVLFVSLVIGITIAAEIERQHVINLQRAKIKPQFIGESWITGAER